MFTEEDRAQVGIGTLIVFIAMVLVAAIAAGVLINTAGMLQSSAEQTADESTAQVTDGLQVFSVIGDASTGDPDDIETIDLTVGTSPGAGNVDLTRVTIQGEVDGTTDVIEVSGSDIDPVTDLDDANDEVLTNSDERASIEIDLTSDLTELEEGEQISLEVTTESGASTFVQKRAPSNLDGESGVSL